MNLVEIERRLHQNPDPILREAGMPVGASLLPRRTLRALASYRRALTFAPLYAMQDDMRDQRFDPLLQPNMTLPPEKVEQMCQAYEKRAKRLHCRALARTVSSRLKRKEALS